jgi:histidyl-tRNA synthetase
MKTETVKGFRDVTGKQAVLRARIKKIIEETYLLYGFEPAETPVIEYEEFVKGENSGDEAVSDIFRLSDKGKRKLALRYEFTFQLKRLAKNKKLPFKRYQIGYVFRDEPIREARYRQFIQCDADIIGSSIKDEAENLKILQEILERLNIESKIYINNRKLLNEILESIGIAEKNRSEVIRIVDKLDKLPEKEIKQELKKYNAEKALAIFKKSEKDFEKYKSYAEIKELKKWCKSFGVKVCFQPTLARGLSYYNGTIFEIKSKEIKQTISGGGSYMVNGIQSTGISFGMAALELLAKLKQDQKKVLIISINQDQKSINLSNILRENKVICSINSSGKVGKAMEYTNSYDYNYVIIIGENEVKSGEYTLKNMASGKEKKVKIKDIVKVFN